MKHKSPQQKKAESYARDHRNSYGENDKASRKAIPRRQKLRNRAIRRLAREPFTGSPRELDEDLVDAMEARVKLKNRRSWVKWPDRPLGEVVKAKLARRAGLEERAATRRH